MGLKPRVSQAQIERFRRTGIRLDRMGRFWHEGIEVTHKGLRRALLRWLDRRETDGRPILRFDSARYAYVEVEDSDLLVLSIEWRNHCAYTSLNDGTEEELEYRSLYRGRENALYCRVRRGRLLAPLSTTALFSLAQEISEPTPGDFVLTAGGRRYDIAKQAPDENL